MTHHNGTNSHLRNRPHGCPFAVVIRLLVLIQLRHIAFPHYALVRSPDSQNADLAANDYEDSAVVFSFWRLEQDLA